MSCTIAVVIATYQRPELLSRCLTALLNQSIPAASYEIIVVDDGHSDDTHAAVSRLRARAPDGPVIRYLRPVGTRGPAGARNRGWRATQAPLIAFTDDDTVPTRDWLAQGSRAMTRNVVAVGGRVVVPASKAPTDHEKMTQGLEAAEFATANAFVWRTALMAVGGFDERFKRAWREDSDLHFSLLKLCGPVGWTPRAVVVHPVRQVPWGVSLRQQANVYFDALLFKKHPKLYRLKIRPHPPWAYYLIVAGSLGAAAAAVAGFHLAAIFLAGVAALGVAQLAARRLRGTSHAPGHVAEMLVTSLAIPFLSVYWRTRGALRFKVLFI